MCKSSARSVRTRSSCALGLLFAAALACSDATRGWVLIKDSPSASDTGSSVDAAGQDAPASSDPARACSPEVTFENRDAAGSGRLFTQLVPDPQGLMSGVVRDVCRLLYRSPDEVPLTRSVHLIVQDFDGVGSASGGQGEAVVRLSSRHMQLVRDSGGDLLSEITGILYYHGANIYQHNAAPSGDDWVIEGVANYVRERAGYLPLSRRPLGGSYRDGFAHSGFFFVWLDERRPGFVYALNQSLAPSSSPWSVATFGTLTGSDIDTLWVEYQATL
jgi:hypothetical protein